MTVCGVFVPLHTLNNVDYYIVLNVTVIKNNKSKLITISTIESSII